MGAYGTSGTVHRGGGDLPSIARCHQDDLLIDHEAAAVDRGLSKHTVRAKLGALQVACDVASRAPLYDHT